MNIPEMIVEMKAAKSLVRLEELRVLYLGRQGIVTQELRKLGTLPIAERKAAGAEINKLKKQIEDELESNKSRLIVETDAKATANPIDLTAPGLQLPYGHRHPVSIVLDNLLDVFWQMGYQSIEGPEVETEWYNFEALNIGPDHPARDMQDTFYLEDGQIPRTHTSAVQIRHMELNKDNLPIRIVAPGKVFRNEDEDARHSWIFHQIEGLVVDEGITLGDLKGTLEAMMRGVLGEETKIRLRSNYFPYTEPSVEMDATCVICKGSGLTENMSCKMCSGTGWLELGGAGMVHPNVLRNAGIDPNRYSGFAFGFGPERIAAIKYGVGDVREFWRPNFNFLKQF
jgi:phenylalanyl-tRNA synthetase alpha chain